MPTPIRPLALVLILLLGSTATARAQLPPVTIPKGLARWDMFTGFGTWDRMFRDGQNVALAQDLVIDSLGSGLWPALASAEALLQRITGLPNARLNLGSTSATRFVTQGTFGMGLAYGLTDRLTVFGRVPLHRIRVRSTLTHDSTTGRAGFNPADELFGDGFGAGLSANFFTGFDAALSALGAAITAGTFDHDQGLKSLAEQTLSQGTMLRNDLVALIFPVERSASPFLPTRTSAEGVALLAKISAIQNTLAGPLGISGFAQTPSLPNSRLSEDGFRDFLQNPDGPVAGSLDAPVLWALGDIEAGVSWSAIDRRSEDGLGFAVAATGSVRFPTGQLDRADRFLDLGTGDRSMDVEVGLTADLVRARFGARLDADYVLRMSGERQRRIAPPSQPLPYAGTLAAVRRNPGDIVRIGVTPFLRLARTFALHAGVRYQRSGSDTHELFAGQEEIPGSPVGLLDEDSKRSLTGLTVGLSYASPLGERNGRPRMPLDAGVTVSQVLAGTGGRIPKPLTVRSWIRLYFRL